MREDGRGSNREPPGFVMTEKWMTERSQRADKEKRHRKTWHGCDVGLGGQAGCFQPTLWAQALGHSLQLSEGPREDRAAHRQIGGRTLWAFWSK